MLLLTLKQHKKSISRLPSLLYFPGSFALHRPTYLYDIPDAKAPLPIALLRLQLGITLTPLSQALLQQQQPQNVIEKMLTFSKEPRKRS